MARAEVCTRGHSACADGALVARRYRVRALTRQGGTPGGEAECGAMPGAEAPDDALAPPLRLITRKGRQTGMIRVKGAREARGLQGLGDRSGAPELSG